MAMAFCFPCGSGGVELRETLFEGVGRVVGGLEQTGAGRVRLGVQTRHVDVQQTAGVLAQTPCHHDLLNIRPVDHVHHRADRIMRRVDGDAVGSDRDDVGLLAGRQRADLIGEGPGRPRY